MWGFFGEVDDAVPEGPEAAFGTLAVAGLGSLNFAGCVGRFDWLGEVRDRCGEGGGACEVGADVLDDFLLFWGRRHCCDCRGGLKSGRVNLEDFLTFASQIYGDEGRCSCSMKRAATYAGRQP